MFPVPDPAERIRNIMEGIRKAYAGISDTDKQIALGFAVEFCTSHRYFEGGDMLAAFRESKNVTYRKIAHQNWRNRWGAFIVSLEKIGMLKAVDRVTPKNKQSHNHSAVLWESMIYQGNEPERDHGYEALKNILAQYESGALTVREAIWKAYKHAVERHG